MKTFQCISCNFQIQRAVTPLSCPACGQQRVGLFVEVGVGAVPQQPAPPPQSAPPLTPVAPVTPPVPGAPVLAPPPPPPGMGVRATPQPMVTPVPAQPLVQPVAPQPTLASAPTPPLQPAAPPQPTVPQPAAPPQPAATQPVAPPQPAAPQRTATVAPHPQPSAAVAPPEAPAPPTSTPPPAPAKPPAERRPRPAAPPQKPAAASPPPPRRPPREAPKPDPRERRLPDRAAPSPPPPARAPEEKKPVEKTPAEVPVSKLPRRRSAAPQAVDDQPAKQTPSGPTIPTPEQFVLMIPAGGPDAGPHAGTRAQAIVDDEGRIYASVGGRLVAIRPDGESLTVDWVYSTGSHVPGNPAVSPDGNIHVHAGDGTLHCITPAGKQAWAPVSVGEPLGWSSPIIDAKGNTWICSYLGGLLKIDDEGHTSDRPYFRTRQKFDSTGVIHRGVFYVGGEDGFVYAIELSSGRRGRNVWDHDKGAGKTDWFINGRLLVTGDGTLVVASRDDCLYGFQPGGELAWKTEMPGQILASPALDARGDIYLGLNCTAKGQAEQGRLICIRGNSHKIAWQHSTAAAIESTPVVGDDGTVYVGDNSGVVHAVGEAGVEQWQAQLAAPVRSAGAIIAPGRVTFGLDDDTLVVLKCSSKSPSVDG